MEDRDEDKAPELWRRHYKGKGRDGRGCEAYCDIPWHRTEKTDSQICLYARGMMKDIIVSKGQVDKNKSTAFYVNTFHKNLDVY